MLQDAILIQLFGVATRRKQRHTVNIRLYCDGMAHAEYKLGLRRLKAHQNTKPPADNSKAVVLSAVIFQPVVMCCFAHPYRRMAGFMVRNQNAFYSC